MEKKYAPWNSCRRVEWKLIRRFINLSKYAVPVGCILQEIVSSGQTDFENSGDVFLTEEWYRYRQVSNSKRTYRHGITQRRVAVVYRLRVVVVA